MLKEKREKREREREKERNKERNRGKLQKGFHPLSSKRERE